MATEPVVVQSIADPTALAQGAQIVGAELRDAAAIERAASANERCATAFERQSAAAVEMVAQGRRFELSQLVCVVAGQRLTSANALNAVKIVTEARALQAEIDRQSSSGIPVAG